MRTSFHHQSEAQPPNGPLTVATSPDTPSPTPATQSVSRKCAARQSSCTESRWTMVIKKRREIFERVAIIR